MTVSVCKNKPDRQAGRQPAAFPVRDVYRRSREELHRTERERERERERGPRQGPTPGTREGPAPDTREGPPSRP